MYSRNGDISLSQVWVFFLQERVDGSIPPCSSSSRVALPSSVFFSEPSNLFPSTDRVAWDYGYAWRRCRGKTLAEATEKHSTHGLQVKEADFAALLEMSGRTFGLRDGSLLPLWQPWCQMSECCKSRNTRLSTLKHHRWSGPQVVNNNPDTTSPVGCVIESSVLNIRCQRQKKKGAKVKGPGLHRPIQLLLPLSNGK